MAPFLIALAKAGLPLLASAIMSEGKEVIEEKLGVDITKLLGSEEGKMKLKELELKHEEFLVTAAQKAAEMEQSNITERWKADMLSDSWLSKNIRPLVLIYLLGAYTVFSIGSGVDFNITQAYVELLAQMLMLVMGAYFAGRTIEKIVDMRERGKQ